MKHNISIPLVDISAFRKQLIGFADAFDVFCYLDNCQATKFPFSYNNYDIVAGFGFVSEYIAKTQENFEGLKEFYEKHKNWLFGFLTYDLKNEIENLKSENPDGLHFPDIHFFVPETVVFVKGNQLTISSDAKTETELHSFYAEIKKNTLDFSYRNQINIKSRLSKNEYIDSVKQLQKHIHYGDIYEVNFCQEFYSENAQVNPVELYRKLTDLSPTPFSAMYKMHDKWLISASPERFLRKIGKQIVSQPIKGTAPRGKNQEEDSDIIEKLKSDTKERAENIMITDLVRNDLSRTACRGSVKVEELCGIYTFRQVHHMISTVSSQLCPDVHFIDAIKSAFPMGSMTGAPKVRAMKLIEKYEKTKRGLYSGSVGYITPEGDFDFNVVIRSILYNATGEYLSYQVGGAITAKSIPEKEYEECLLKAKAINQLFGKKQNQS